MGNGCVIIECDMLFWKLEFEKDFFRSIFLVFCNKKKKKNSTYVWNNMNGKKKNYDSILIFRWANLLKQAFDQTPELSTQALIWRVLVPLEREQIPCTPQTNKTFMDMWCKQLLSEREEKYLSVWLIPTVLSRRLWLAHFYNILCMYNCSLKLFSETLVC